jgi:hypothetical protein
VGILLEEGFDHLTTVRAFYLLTSYVEGYALSEIAGLTGRSPLSSASADTPAAVPAASRANPFPHLAALRDTFATHGREQTSEFGREVLLAGLRVIATGEGDRDRSSIPTYERARADRCAEETR